MFNDNGQDQSAGNTGSAGAKTGNGKSKRAPLKVVNEMSRMNRPPKEWIVKGLIPRRGLIAIYGPSGAGKGFLLIDLIKAILEGRKWFGHQVKVVPVLYMCLEGDDGLDDRLAAYRKVNGDTHGIDVMSESFNLLNAEDEALIIQAIKGANIEGGAVFLDTFAQATPGMDENGSRDMTVAIAACQRIQQATNTLFGIVHHTGKDPLKGMRGSSALIGALDAAIEVTGSASTSKKKWRSVKVKEGTAGKTFPFDLKQVLLGNDSDGDAITSCVVVAGVQVHEGNENDSSDDREGAAKEGSLLSGVQKLVLTALERALECDGVEPPDESPAPMCDAGMVVSNEAWQMQAFATPGLTAPRKGDTEKAVKDERVAKGAAYRRAKEFLIKNEYVCCGTVEAQGKSTEYYWLNDAGNCASDWAEE